MVVCAAACPLQEDLEWRQQLSAVTGPVDQDGVPPLDRKVRGRRGPGAIYPFVGHSVRVVRLFVCAPHTMSVLGHRVWLAVCAACCYLLTYLHGLQDLDAAASSWRVYASLLTNPVTRTTKHVCASDSITTTATAPPFPSYRAACGTGTATCTRRAGNWTAAATARASGQWGSQLGGMKAYAPCCGPHQCHESGSVCQKR